MSRITQTQLADAMLDPANYDYVQKLFELASQQSILRTREALASKLVDERRKFDETLEDRKRAAFNEENN